MFSFLDGVFGPIFPTYSSFEGMVCEDAAFRKMIEMQYARGLMQSEEARDYNIRGSISIEKSKGTWVWEDLQ